VKKLWSLIIRGSQDGRMKGGSAADCRGPPSKKKKGKASTGTVPDSGKKRCEGPLDEVKDSQRVGGEGYFLSRREKKERLMGKNNSAG